MEWFRWYHGTVSDPKFSVIAKRSKQPRHVVIACWPALLEYSSSRDDRGTLAGIDLEEVAIVLDLETEQVEAVYHAMVEKDMIEDDRLRNWDKRQPPSDCVGERVKRHRDKKKIEQMQEYSEFETIGNVTETECNVTETCRAEESRREQSRAEQNRNKTLKPCCNTREKFEFVLAEKRSDLQRLFAGKNIDVVAEKLMNHYRNREPPLDIWAVTLKWFQREFDHGNETLLPLKSRAEQRIDSNIAAAREASRLLKEAKSGIGQR